MGWRLGFTVSGGFNICNLNLLSICKGLFSSLFSPFVAFADLCFGTTGNFILKDKLVSYYIVTLDCFYSVDFIL